MAISVKEKTLIQKNTLLILIGCIVFSSVGILNILFRFTPLLPNLFPKLIISNDPELITSVFNIIGYVMYSITFASLLPIGIGIRNITDIYFVDHITKSGRQTATWIFIYSGAVLLDMISLGWAIISGFVALAIIVGRVMSFIKINKTFDKIKRIFDVNIGSFFYILFAYYAIITMTLGAVANYAGDIEFEVYLAVFNGVIESALMIIVGIKLIIDIYRIKEFIETANIKPYSAKKAFLTKNRTETPVLTTTKNHIQSQTQLEQFQKRAAKQEMRIEKFRERTKSKRIARNQVEGLEDTKIEYIICNQCKERTDKNLPYCTNCGESLKNEIVSMKKEISEVSVRRTLSPTKEKILQQITIAIFLIAFVTYAFIIGDFTLTIYAWVIIAIFATYLIVNYIVLFFSGRGFALTTILSDIAFMFIILPVLCAIFSYFVALVIQKTTDMTFENSRWITIGLSIALSLVTIYLMLNYKVSHSNMNLKDYLKYRLDFKSRAEELNKDKMRVEKKRANFDNLDRIEARIAKQLEENVIDYKDFDYKQRLKDLGSPLRNDEDEEE